MMSGMLVPIEALEPEVVDKAAVAVQTLFGVDPEFVELCKILYGDDVDPVEIWRDVFSKDEPSGSDMHVPGTLEIDTRIGRRRAREGKRRAVRKLDDRKKRGLVAAASGAGAVAGGVGLAAGAKEYAAARRAGVKMSRLGRGLLIAEPIGLTGEIGATHFLGQDARKGKAAKRDTEVEKIGVGALANGIEAGMRRIPGLGGLAPKVKPAVGRVAGVASEARNGARAARTGQTAMAGTTSRAYRASNASVNAAKEVAPGAKQTMFGSRKRTAITAGVGTAAAVGVHQSRKPAPQYGVKAARDDSDELDVTWAGEFEKFDEDKHLVFGWASVVEVNGMPVVDRQGDYIHPEDLENASYEYVIKSRVGGDMHSRSGEVPFKVSDLVESVVVTPEKLEKMGIPASVAKSMPVGWWVGFKVHSDKHWDMVKKQARTGFSIHGRGKRIPMTMDQLIPGYH